jgi:hypothetical protein
MVEGGSLIMKSYMGVAVCHGTGLVSGQRLSHPARGMAQACDECMPQSVKIQDPVLIVLIGNPCSLKVCLKHFRRPVSQFAISTSKGLGLGEFATQ